MLSIIPDFLVSLDAVFSVLTSNCESWYFLCPSQWVFLFTSLVSYLGHVNSFYVHVANIYFIFFYDPNKSCLLPVELHDVFFLISAFSSSCFEYHQSLQHQHKNDFSCEHHLYHLHDNYFSYSGHHAFHEQ